MTLPLPLHPEALEELISSALWYEEQRPGLGDEFEAAVDQAMRTGAQLTIPGRGPGSPLRRILLERRFPYTLILELRGDELPMVLAVAHHSRRPGYWLSRRSQAPRPRHPRRPRR